jgi:hypothetical protein
LGVGKGGTQLSGGPRDAGPTDWAKLTGWGVVLPPNRPPEWYLNVLRARLTRLSEGEEIAILGCTPEFRDLAAQLRLRVTLFDRSAEFYEVANSLRYSFFTGNERLVEGDWLNTLPMHPGRFAAVLSDLTLGNLPYEDQALLGSAVAVALRHDGVVIDRVLTNSEGFQPLAQLERTYEQRPLNLQTLNDFNADFLFTSELVEAAGIVDSSQLLTSLHNRYFDSPIFGRLTRLVQLITPYGTRWWYGRRWDTVAPNYFPTLELTQAYKAPLPGAYSRYAFVAILTHPSATVCKIPKERLPAAAVSPTCRFRS